MPTASTFSAANEQTIRLGNLGPDVSGRTLGETVRGEISPKATTVIFDCTGVEAMSPSFADEVFGKIAAEADRPHIQVINGNRDVLSAIRFAVRQRSA